MKLQKVGNLLVWSLIMVSNFQVEGKKLQSAIQILNSISITLYITLNEFRIRSFLPTSVIEVKLIETSTRTISFYKVFFLSLPRFFGFPFIVFRYRCVQEYFVSATKVQKSLHSMNRKSPIVTKSIGCYEGEGHKFVRRRKLTKGDRKVFLYPEWFPWI